MTTIPTAIPPVRKQVTINAPREHVFKVFTDGIDRWWPRGHHIGKTPATKFIIEPKLGGRWYATHEDGSETNTGKVLVWDPPSRLMLSWQVMPDWSYDPDFVTEVDVRFSEQVPGVTVVDFEHRDLEKYGAAADAMRKGIDSPDGWGAIFARFAEEAAKL